MNLATPLRRAAAVLGSIALAASGALVAGQQPAHAAEATIISTATTQWRFLDDGTNPAAGDTPDAWAAPSFDDASWKTAAGSFGAKRGIIDNVDGYTPATLLNQYASEGVNNPAFFFRTDVALTADQVADAVTATATIVYDDSASLFVNGTYVGGGHDADLQADAARNTSFGGSNHAAPNSVDVDIPLELLEEGDNTFGVRLHNGRESSSDIYLDVASVVISSEEPPAPLVWSYHDLDADPTAGLDDPHAWAAESFDDSAWKSASGSFGAIRGELGSVNGFLPDNLLTQYRENGENIPAFFLRTTVDVTAEQLADAYSLDAEIRYDDAVALFVNGTYAGGLDDSSFRAMDNPNQEWGGSNSGTPKLGTVAALAELFVEGENTIAVRLHNGRPTSSDLYFEWHGLTKNTEVPPPPAAISNLILGVGVDETERNLVWYSAVAESQAVTFAKSSALVDGALPTDATVVEPDSSGAALALDKFYNHATITGLEADTSYTYRVGSETGGHSELIEFSTEAAAEFEYITIGDAQIGSSGNPERDSEGWTATMDLAQEMFPGANLLVSAGDQVESAGNEDEYLGFTAPDAVRELATATTIGNHDVGNRTTYEQHINNANRDEATRDAWFTYNDVLFIVINTNHRDTPDHKAFMEAAIAEAGDVQQKVVVMHHSIYSTASHANDGDIIERRATLPAVFTELGIDYVLSGHDHVYTRTHLMSDGEPVTSGSPETVTPMAGEWMYLTLNSSSGSKFYTVKDQEFPYASVINQERVANFTHVSVGECRTDFTTYRGDKSVVDEFGINNIKAVPTIEAADATITVSEATTFDVLAGVRVVDACEDLVADASGEVEAQEGSYELTHTVVDGYGNQAQATRTITVTADKAPEPTPTPTVTVTATPEPAPTVTVTAEPEQVGGGDLYETPGFHSSGGRDWMTVCEPYSSTVRCHTYIWGTQIHQDGDHFFQANGWVFNNLTYVASPKELWQDNPLASTGRWSDADGRNWRTECNTPAVGGNGCRTYVEAKVIERTATGHRVVTKEVFNNLVRFS